MLKIALCDDDSFIYDELKGCLSAFSIRHNESFELQYYKAAQELLDAPFDYNILFLDIMLDNGQDGIEIGKLLRERENTAIIHLLTSRKDRIKDGYKATVMRYLMKPIEQTELDEALLASLKILRSSKKILPVMFKQKTVYVEIENIVLAESYYRKRYIHTTSGRLETMEKWLPLCERLKGKGFFLPQKYILINFAHIQSATKQTVTMKNGRTIIFAKGVYENFNREYMHHLGGKNDY